MLTRSRNGSKVKEEYSGARFARLFAVATIACAVGWIGVDPSLGAVRKPAPKPPKRSVAGFCKASKAWVDWETVTLGVGPYNEQWVKDTKAYLEPIFDTAPKEISSSASYVVVEILNSRSNLVGFTLSATDLEKELATLVFDGVIFKGPKFVAQRDKFAAFMLAKCKIDYTAPFKAYAAKAGGN